MHDQPLAVVDSNSARAFGGAVLGLPLPLFFRVIAAFVAGGFVYLLLQPVLPAWASVGAGLLPAVLALAYIILLHHGKPPGYARDAAEQAVNGGAATPPGSPQVPPLFAPLPDIFLRGGLLFFGGPHGRGQVAGGFWLEPPALQTAAHAARNQLAEITGQWLRLLPANFRLQVQWWAEADFRAPLRAYQAATPAAGNPLARRLRNLTWLWFWQRLERRELRRERVAVFMGRELDSATRAAAVAGGDALGALQTEFAELTQRAASLYARIGGAVTPMTDADLFRLYHRKFNPGLAVACAEDAPLEFDPATGVVEQVWQCELRGQGARGFFLDEQYHAVLGVKQWPAQVTPTLFHHLTQLPFHDYEISVRVEKIAAEDLIATEQRALDRVQRQLAEKPDARLNVTGEQLAERIRRLSAGTTLPLRVEYLIIARGRTPEELSARLLALKSALHGLPGARYYEATLAASARHAFFRTLPGWLWSSSAGWLLYGEDSYVSGLLPLSASFVGHLHSPGGADALYPGANGSVVGIKNFLGAGAAATPQHLVVLGATGSGKSVWLQNLLQQTDPDFACTVIVEEGLSHAAYTRGHGVAPLRFRLDGAQTLNPFDTHGLPLSSFHRSSLTALLLRMTGVPRDEDAARARAATLAQHVARLGAEHATEWLRHQPVATRLELARTALALERFARERQLAPAEAWGDFRALEQAEPATWAILLAAPSEAEVAACEAHEPAALLDLVYTRLGRDEALTLSSLRDALELQAEGGDGEECRRLAAALAPFCRDGHYGTLWDGPATLTLAGPVIHFELGLIPESARELKALLGFVLIHHVRQHLLTLPRAARKRVVIEEASRFLDVPGGDQILRETHEQFRKFNVQVISVWQQYARLADTSLRAAILGNARAFVIFNPGDRRDVERLAADLGLAPALVESILRQPRPDQQTGPKFSSFCYFHHADHGRPLCGLARHVVLPDETNPITPL